MAYATVTSLCNLSWSHDKQKLLSAESSKQTFSIFSVLYCINRCTTAELC